MGERWKILKVTTFPMEQFRISRHPPKHHWSNSRNIWQARCLLKGFSESCDQLGYLQKNHDRHPPIISPKSVLVDKVLLKHMALPSSLQSLVCGSDKRLDAFGLTRVFWRSWWNHPSTLPEADSLENLSPVIHAICSPDHSITDQWQAWIRVNETFNDWRRWVRVYWWVT